MEKQKLGTFSVDVDKEGMLGKLLLQLSWKHELRMY